MTQPDSPIFAQHSHGFRVCSSFAGEICDLDAWRDANAAAAYEWWYFDAVSDDGRTAIVVIFLSNFVFSPRYNRHVARHQEQLPTPAHERFPAVAFTVYRDGRPLLRQIQEYDAGDFGCDAQNAACRIGTNRFELVNDRDGSAYRLSIELPLRRKRRVRAEFRWHVTSGNLLDDEERPDDAGATSHQWNLVAPRCAVTGNVNVTDGARSTKQICFQGVGYHDHNRDRRWMPEAFTEWHWGRAHFEDYTAVFYRYVGTETQRPLTRLFLVEHRTNVLRSFEASFAGSNRKRNIFGLSFHETLELRPIDEPNQNACALNVDGQRVIDASFFYLRFRGVATLSVGNRVLHTAPLISEYLRPQPLANRALWWLVNMRIGRNDRHSFLS